MLESLRRGEFVYEQPAVIETEYSFKHALTQEVAYNSVLGERRKILHQGTGEAIETLYAEHIEDHLDALAHHFSRSADVSKAVNYLCLAADQCVERTAHLQALTYLNQGLELVETLPEGLDRSRQELALLIGKGRSVYVTQGWASPETARAYQRARELCLRFGDDNRLFWVLWGLRLFHRWRLELVTSTQMEEELVSIA
jgi:predicted ATPase